MGKDSSVSSLDIVLQHYPHRHDVLYEPAPTSTPLMAVLMLLDTPYIPKRVLERIRGNTVATKPSIDPNLHPSLSPSDDSRSKIDQTLIQSHDENDFVYIIPRMYLQNWIYWAYCQKVPEQEKGRLLLALTMATALYEIEAPDRLLWRMEDDKTSHTSAASFLSEDTFLGTAHANISNPSEQKLKVTIPSKKKNEISKKKKKNNQNSVDVPIPSKTNHDGNDSMDQQGIRWTPKAGLSLRDDVVFADPGPVDSTSLSSPGQPLLMRSGVVVDRCSGDSVPDNFTTVESPQSSHQRIDCVAVPVTFYELIRGCHGVLCNDGISVSFQSSSIPTDIESVILHHQALHPCKSVHTSMPSLIEEDESNDSKPHHLDFQASYRDKNIIRYDGLVKPVEFRRRVLTYELTPTTFSTEIDLNRLRKVELYPVQFNYYFVEDNDFCKEKFDLEQPLDKHPDGFILISRSSCINSSFKNILKCTAPEKSLTCVRLWYEWKCAYRQDRKTGATVRGDGFELFDSCDFTSSKHHEGRSDAYVSVEEWSIRQSSVPWKMPEKINVLVEIRKSSQNKWPRHNFDLSSRLQIGDFVDAKHKNGHWYEAVIREVTDDTVKLHYCGWSSKWDCYIRKFQNSVISAKSYNTARHLAPLWSHTKRWRESISIGDQLEVRDSSSLLHQPKWLSGIVKWVGNDSETLHNITCGADLEMLDVDNNGFHTHLLLLKRTRQILVQVDQECLLGSSTMSKSERSFESSTVPLANPPSIRWVNLYGEEICYWNTHLPTQTPIPGKPATLQYECNDARPLAEIMRPKSPAYGAGFVRESLKGIPLANGSVGLHNLGNTCYMNSILQCLNHYECITSYFISGTYQQDLNKTNPLGSGGNVAASYAALLNDMWSGEFTILAPRRIKQTVAKFAPQFNNFYQHDSHEFCSFLLDALHEDLNRVKDKPYIENVEGIGVKSEIAAMRSWKDYLSRHDSVFVDSFHGMHKSHITCPHCGKESIKFDVYSSLSLPVVSSYDKKPTTIASCLEKFTEGEYLDDDNAWYCSTCRRHVCALKAMTLWTTPDCLIVHLKRFTFNACANKNGVSRSKIQDVVYFPIDKLDLTQYVLGPWDRSAPPVYKLVGVADHSGMTSNSGHYTATVRNMKNGQWYRYNDGQVGVTTAEVAVSSGAYVLFYERICGKSRWAGMETCMKLANFSSTGSSKVDHEGYITVASKKKKKP